MAPPSLVDICIRKCIKHASMIHDLGDLPIHLAKPILRRIDNVKQLREIELNSPQFADETIEIWKKLIARDFPNWHKKNYIPKNPRSWYRVYAKYKKESDAELAAAQDKLKNAFSALKADKAAMTTGSIETRDLPRLPKDGRPVGGTRGPGRGLPDHLTWGGGSRTKLTDGQSFLKKARREAREYAYRRQLATPMGKLKVPEGQIKKAPDAMVQQYRVQRQDEFRIRAPRKSKSAAQLAEEAERKEREARLLKIKNLTGGRPAQMVSDSEADDHEEDDDEGSGYRGLRDIIGYDDEEPDLFGDGDEEGAASEPQRLSKKEPQKRPATYHSDASSAPSKRPALLSNSRKPGSGLLDFKPGAQQRVARPLSKPSAAPAQPPGQGSPPPKPRQPAHASAPPPTPVKTQLPQSSPPPRPQSTSAGSPPPAMMRKRKPQVDVFMRQNKKPRK